MSKQVIEITPEMFALSKGEGAKLDDKGKANVLAQMCHTLGLNPAGVPIQFITLNGKLVPYLTRGATDQIRHNHGISTEIVERATVTGVHVVRVKVTLPDGRVDESTGAVSIEGLKGESLANALMKAETKAKRRATLCAVGLGMMDESELPIDPVPAPARPAQSARAAIAVKPEVSKSVAPALEAPAQVDDPFPIDAAPVEVPAQVPQEKATKKQLDELVRLVKQLGMNGAALIAPYGAKSSKDLTWGQACELLTDLTEMAKEREALGNG